MDVKYEVTAKIIEALEKGENEFRDILVNGAAGGVPVNAKTGKRYNGSNVLLLWISAQMLGYKSPLWLTYKQAQEMGGQVKKGEKATLCSYFDKRAKKSKAELLQDDEDKQEFYFLCKPFYVFNVDQIENLPDSVMAQVPELSTKQNAHIEEIDLYFKNTGVQIESTKKNVCFYDRKKDVINVPEIEYFTKPENYYLALAHETAHWTGAEHRLNRVKGKKFGDDVYAFEELIAEVTGSIVMGRFGLLGTSLENHASYLQNWLDVLHADKNAIFAASRMAFEAYDYLESLQENTIIERAA